MRLEREIRALVNNILLREHELWGGQELFKSILTLHACL